MRHCGEGVFIENLQRLSTGDAIIIAGTTLRFDVRYEATPAAKPIADLKQVINRGANTSVRFRGEEAIVIPLEDGRLTFGRGADRDVIISGLPLVIKVANMAHDWIFNQAANES